MTNLATIARATRASAANLATAMRHAGEANRARQDAARIMARLPLVAAPEGKAFYRAQAEALNARAARAEGLAARAMARHEAARNRADSF